MVNVTIYSSTMDPMGDPPCIFSKNLSWTSWLLQRLLGTTPSLAVWKGQWPRCWPICCRIPQDILVVDDGANQNIGEVFLSLDIIYTQYIYYTYIIIYYKIIIIMKLLLSIIYIYYIYNCDIWQLHTTAVICPKYIHSLADLPSSQEPFGAPLWGGDSSAKHLGVLRTLRPVVCPMAGKVGRIELELRHCSCVTPTRYGCSIASTLWWTNIAMENHHF